MGNLITTDELAVMMKEGFDEFKTKIDTLKDEVAKNGDLFVAFMIRFDAESAANQEAHRRFEERFDQIDTKFDQFEERFDQVDIRFDRVETRLDRVELRLDQVDTRLERVDTRLDHMDIRLDRIDGHLALRSIKS